MQNRRLQSLFVTAASFAYLLGYPLAIGRADESHLLYAAKRVLEGEVLYRDVFEILPPLGYYLFAAIYRVAGTTLLAARVGMAAIEAVGCALFFHLVRRVSGGAEAVVATLIFVGICIPTWPYASHHWIVTTLALLVAAVTLAERWQGSHARPLVGGLVTGVAICVQQHGGALLGAWLLLALGVLALSLPPTVRWRTLVTEIVWSSAGIALVVSVVIGHAAWASSLGTVVDQLYGFAVRHYPRASLGKTPWAAVLPLTNEWRVSTWLWLLRVSPLFLVAEGVLLLRGGRHPRERQDLERACLWLLALTMALSISYLPDFIHVSFVMPFLLIAGATLLRRFRASSIVTRLPAGRHAVTVGTWLFALAVALKGVANVAHAHANAPIRLETAFGVVRVDARMERLFYAVRRHLVTEADGRTLLYSYPNDAWLYLTLPADNATRFSVLLAGSFPAESVQQVVEVLRARRPGTVLLSLPFATGSVADALDGGYDATEEVGGYRVYVRRESRAREFDIGD